MSHLYVSSMVVTSGGPVNLDTNQLLYILYH